MGKVTELIVTKGKTVKAENRDEWTRVEYSVKAAISDYEELEVAKAHVEGVIDGWLSNALGALALVSAKQTQPSRVEVQHPLKPIPTVESADIFPEELKALLNFEDKGEWTIIKPRQFLGSENFAKVADIIKKHSGEYISAGKESHFRIPKATAK